MDNIDDFAFQSVTDQSPNDQNTQHHINFNSAVEIKHDEAIILIQPLSTLSETKTGSESATNRADNITLVTFVVPSTSKNISSSSTHEIGSDETKNHTITMSTTMSTTFPVPTSSSISTEPVIVPCIMPRIEPDIELRQTNSRELKEAAAANTAGALPMKILLVDDVPSCRKMTRRMLEDRGHYCEEAATGLIAVDMVKAQLLRMATAANSMITTETVFGLNDSTNRNFALRNYDVILMDFVMPTMNGPDATREIRALGYAKPIIGVTGNALDSDKEIFINAGASDVIIKPLRLNVLLGIIDL